MNSPALKSFSRKLVGMFCCQRSESKYERLDSRLQKRMIEIKRRSSQESNFRSINAIILKFPKFKEGLQEIRNVFEQCDEDKNEIIDRAELRKCLQKLQLTISEEEIDDLFNACDIDENEGIRLNEFTVLLCLIYVLSVPSDSSHNKLKILTPQLEEEMDWHRKGKVGFREFLFAFIKWIGIESESDDEEIYIESLPET
ncbi:OLC1v1019239C4 [Oldenlandia corymbosa var. corymbosa]|uniref:OLC1v1019239C4 n=1 Tax=Oldenlandia corymbosa var. corymbosa TaxID=529605 RepID=A0AAV1EDE4_OLDCO|nr:OLC1v1019239C4 [Oldenlandia corymbosa var. corymbosa]